VTEQNKGRATLASGCLKRRAVRAAALPVAVFTAFMGLLYVAGFWSPETGGASPIAVSAMGGTTRPLRS
jgi:hypothetical protein